MSYQYELLKLEQKHAKEKLDLYERFHKKITVNEYFIKKFCDTHIEEKASIYGNLKFGFALDLYNQWFKNEFGDRYKEPHSKVLKAYMEQKYGKCPNNGWSNISIKEDEC